ncbi:peptide deformylase [Bifidobacterium xylocopae]|uniref:Peptide deformylase n=1 Tax=Bifidobacterium xylocopae TaxID=2493119 RepID=A0A366KDS1_9BIFI|nr:peptide deformylase [Bifidobacterium xylocopae]RBP99876.1 peptide deformylase [Bifidobacterium xylocopae]
MFTRNANVDAELNREVELMLAQDAEDGILPIVQLGEPVLRRKAARYEGQLKRKILDKLIEVMHRTMLEAPGVGLAAPQIGLGLTFAVIEDHIRDSEDDPREITELPFRAIINPTYEPIGDKTASFYEGCLSFSGYQAVRKRWLDVKATWEDESGKRHEEDLHGWPARIFQHETDHLHGEVYIDKALTRSLSSDENLSEYWAYDPVPTQAAEELGFDL